MLLTMQRRRLPHTLHDSPSLTSRDRPTFPACFPPWEDSVYLPVTTHPTYATKHDLGAVCRPVERVGVPMRGDMREELQALSAAVRQFSDPPTRDELRRAITALRLAWFEVSAHCLMLNRASFEGRDLYFPNLRAIHLALQAGPPSPRAEADLSRLRWYAFLYGVLTQLGPIALREVMAKAADMAFRNEDMMQLIEPHLVPL